MSEVTKLTKKNKNVLLTIVGVAIIAGGLFYWFQWRPSEIRKECSKIALDGAIKEHKSDYPYETRTGIYSNKAYNSYYDICLQRKGLK